KVNAAVRNEVAGQFQQITPVALQTIFLLYGVFVALKSGNPGAAGAILGIFYFVPMAVNPIQQIIQFINGLNSAWPQVEQVVEVLEATPEVSDRPGAVDMKPGSKAIVAEDLSFAYVAGGAQVLDHVTLTFPAGKISAIVGRAGSGKSSLLNLVSRLRDPQGGRLLLGDQDVRSIRLASLRRQVARVSQFPLYLNDTIRANFRLASARAADAEIEAVCRRTGIWEVLERAAGPGKNPLDYVLPRNVAEGLSGGQRRLLAVTRALLLKPSILMLDEPTTGIDALGRAQLAEVLKEACKDCTVLLVDHSMEFIYRVADQVCCLENGKFVDVGSPEELSQRPNLFQSLLQASQEEDQETVSQER
ncbi:MAG: ABC transporter ATP-binding protein, partial [Candidatus Eremiobacterota bacterium]